MKQVLIVVDYQVDFVADDGKLTAGKSAQLIESTIERKIRHYQSENQPVFFTLDAHTNKDWDEALHPEAAVFLKHCIKGTDGYTLYGSIKDSADAGVCIDKRAYCPIIEGTALGDVLMAANRVEVCGVVTDICVFQTVVGVYTYLINNGKKADIIVDTAACASFDADREQIMLAYMKEVLGVTVL